ncbi:phage tail protein [Pseudomonas sp. TSRC2-2]|uniref:phage tail protein n=1 Tax=unclassified Pseudomonas TaxID=196821 RepID=UPI003CFA2668
MAEEFIYDVEVGADGDVSQRTWENEFGDGYVQAGGIGINTKSQAWNLTHTGSMEQGEELPLIWAFLDRHEGYKSFLWTPPGGVRGRYRCNGYKPRAAGPGLFTLTFAFKQVYTP